NRLYRNLGNWKFEDVTDTAGLRGEGFSIGAAAADFDGNGWIDLFVAGAGKNLLYRNIKGRFEPVAIRDEKWSVGGSCHDYDNDSRPDILITALPGETFPLFRNTGAGFIDVTYPSKSGIATARRSGWGVALADLNNDGWKDIITANGHVTDNIDQLRSER